MSQFPLLQDTITENWNNYLTLFKLSPPKFMQEEFNSGTYLLHLSSQISKELFRTGRTMTSLLQEILGFKRMKSRERGSVNVHSTYITSIKTYKISVLKVKQIWGWCGLKLWFNWTHPFLCSPFPSFLSIKIRTLLLFFKKIYIFN